MSYARYKDKIFQFQPRLAVRKNSDTQLRSSSSCSDLTKWSNEDHGSTECIFEKADHSRTAAGKFVPPDCLISLLQCQQNKLFKAPSFSQLKKSSSAESLVEFEKRKLKREYDTDDIEVSSKRSQPFSETSSLADPQDHDNNRALCRLQDEEEIENLRKLVRDMKDQLSYLEQFKHENVKLKQLLSDDTQRQLDRALSENNLLSKKLDLYENLHEKRLETIGAVSKLRGECRQLEGALEAARYRNEALEKKIRTEAAAAARALTQASAQVTASEERASALESMLPALTLQLRTTTEAAAWQQERFTEKLVRLKQIADMNFSRAESAQKKLTMCEELVAHLECVRAELRTSNECYKEAAMFFRNQMQIALAAGQSLAKTIDELSEDLRKNKLELEHSSHWPGSAETTVQLARMKGILQDSTTGSTASLALARLRKVMMDLEKSTWSKRGRTPPCPLTDAAAQCVPFSSVAQIQAVPNTLTTFVQTTILTVIEAGIQADKSEAPELSPDERAATGTMVAAAAMIRLRSKAERASRRAESAMCIAQTSEAVLCLYTAHFNSLLHQVDSDFQAFISSVQLYCDLNFQLSQMENEDLIRLMNAQNEQYESRMKLLESTITLLEGLLSDEAEFRKKLEEEIKILTEDLLMRNCVVEKLCNLWKQAENELGSQAKLQSKESQQEQGLLTQVRQLSISVSEKDREIRYLQKINTAKEGELQSVRYNSHHLKKRLILYRKTRRNHRDKLIKMKKKVRGVKKKIAGMKSVFLKSTELFELLKKSNESLCKENYLIKEENEKINNKFSQTKKIIWKLKSSLNKECSKSFKLEADNARNRKHLETANARLNQMASLEKQNSHQSQSVSKICYDLQKSINDRESTIRQLQDEVVHLKDYTSNLEAKCKEIEMRHKETRDSTTSIDEEFDILIHCEQALDKMKDDFSQEVEELKRKNLKKCEEDNRLYLNNLSLLKETYERDIKIIKSDHADSLAKIQDFQREEIANLRRLMADVDSSKDEELDQVKRDFEEQMNNQKLNYENVLRDQMLVAKEEKEKLSAELARVTAEKDATIMQLSDKMENEINILKKKCKQYLSRYEKDRNSSICSYKSDYYNRVENIGDGKLISPNDSVSEVDGSYGCYQGSYEVNLEVYQDPGGAGDGSDEKAYLLSKIAQLEEQLMEYNCYSSENACDAEKGIWKERERNNELNLALQREVEENRLLCAKLKNERQRVSELEEKNIALIEEMKQIAQSKWAIHENLIPFNQRKYSDESLEEKLLSDYADRRMEFIQQCGIKHNVSKRLSSFSLDEH